MNKAFSMRRGGPVKGKAGLGTRPFDDVQGGESPPQQRRKKRQLNIVKDIPQSWRDWRGKNSLQENRAAANSRGSKGWRSSGASPTPT